MFSRKSVGDFYIYGEQGWCSNENARPASIPAGSHMWVEFFVGSQFFSGYCSFLPPQKPTFLNSNSIWNPKATGL